MTAATLSFFPPDPAKREYMEVHTKKEPSEQKTRQARATEDTPRDLTRLLKGSMRQALIIELKYSFDEHLSE